jgi:hypothetical protein
LAAWEAGGPAQLRENVRQNLFTPWLLRQICAKFGIHFFTLNQSKNAGGSIEANSRCAVVSHFADKLAKLELEFGNQNWIGNEWKMATKFVFIEMSIKKEFWDFCCGDLHFWEKILIWNKIIWQHFLHFHSFCLGKSSIYFIAGR